MTVVSDRYGEAAQEDILNMPIADGLKEVLVNCGFTRHQILTYTTEELATILDIDKYVASIILNAAKY
jgi:hypothetical protein